MLLLDNFLFEFLEIYFFPKEIFENVQFFQLRVKFFLLQGGRFRFRFWFRCWNEEFFEVSLLTNNVYFFRCLFQKILSMLSQHLLLVIKLFSFYTSKVILIIFFLLITIVFLILLILIAILFIILVPILQIIIGPSL